MTESINKKINDIGKMGDNPILSIISTSLQQNILNENDNDISQKYELYFKNLKNGDVNSAIRSLNNIIDSIERMSLIVWDKSFEVLDSFEVEKNAYLEFLMGYQYIIKYLIKSFDKDPNLDKLETLFNDFKKKKNNLFILINTKENMEIKQEKRDVNKFIEFYNEVAHNEWGYKFEENEKNKNLEDIYVRSWDKTLQEFAKNRVYVDQFI